MKTKEVIEKLTEGKNQLTKEQLIDNAIEAYHRSQSATSQRDIEHQGIILGVFLISLGLDEKEMMKGVLELALNDMQSMIE